MTIYKLNVTIYKLNVTIATITPPSLLTGDVLSSRATLSLNSLPTTRLLLSVHETSSVRRVLGILVTLVRPKCEDFGPDSDWDSDF